MAEAVAKRVIVVILALAGTAGAQTVKEVRAEVVYISGDIAYINAGRLDNVAPGDTAFVHPDSGGAGSLIITAIADSSSSARILTGARNIRIGNSVSIRVSTPEGSKESVVLRHTGSGRRHAVSSPAPAPPARDENVISGQVALQYSLIAAESSALNLSQPAAMVRLSIRNLLGAGMSLRLYGLSFLNGNAAYALYGNRAGLQNNFYEISLTGETPGSLFGYGIGRMHSRFVSGLGTFDGGEAYVHVGDFTAGALGGAVPLVPSSTLGYSGTNSAAFLNFHTGTDMFHQYDGTFAYAQRLVGGKLDRNFLYTQNSLSLGSELNLYESTEVDLNKMSAGRRTPGMNLTNTFVSLNYFPASWLFANVGYDAYRTVYLFQTMKSVPDSLINTNLLQGFRGSVTAYLPGAVALSLNGSYRNQKGFPRSDHSIGGMLRSSDLLDLGIGGSITYTSMTGAYSNANDTRLELDRTFFDALDITLSYESYNISVSLLQQTYSTQTISGYFDYTFAKRWFSSLGIDDVLDPSMNSFRLYAELGIRL